MNQRMENSNTLLNNLIIIILFFLRDSISVGIRGSKTFNPEQYCHYPVDLNKTGEKEH